MCTALHCTALHCTALHCTAHEEGSAAQPARQTRKLEHARLLLLLCACVPVSFVRILPAVYPPTLMGLPRLCRLGLTPHHATPRHTQRDRPAYHPLIYTGRVY